MTELRDPDPTLTELGEYGDVYIQWGTRPVPTAHHESGPQYGPPTTTRCGLSFAADPVDASAARWFAVPCRACFPDAGPPGTNKGWRAPGERPSPDYPNEHLAWQVAVENAAV